MSDITIARGRPSDAREPVETAVYDLLDALGVDYARVDHHAAETIAECRDVEEAIGRPICKNLFLCNKQKTLYCLVMLPGDKTFNTRAVSDALGCARLSFADGDAMENFLGVRPGSASVLGLMHDTRHCVRLVMDRSVAEGPYICCHPCKNTTTLVVDTRDILEKFLKHTGHAPVIVG